MTKTMNLNGQQITASSLVMTAKCQLVRVQSVDKDNAYVEYPNGRRGNIPVRDLEVIQP